MPWFREIGRRTSAFAGPDALTLDGDVAHEREGDDVVADFWLDAGRHVEFRLTWSTRATSRPPTPTSARALRATERWWRDWAGRCRYDGPYRDAVVRSLITLKAMTYAPSGGIVAAPTTSLPEQLGGVRNWDYRYCWIRDATFTLLALLDAGYEAEAVAWREWLLRAVAGRPEQMQLMYGVEGERRLTEYELSWLPGYAGSGPVRVGNAASEQFQLDVYGELMDALHQARAHGIPPDEAAWDVQRALLEFLESHWREPDDGIWEMRGERRALRALEGDGVGGGGPRGARRRGVRARRAGRRLEAAARRHRRRGVHAAASTPGAARSPSTTARGSSTRRCC